MTMPSAIAIRCPACKRALRPVPLMESATLVLRRTCKCGIAWSLKAAPVSVRDGVAIHALDWRQIDAKKSVTASVSRT